MNLAELKVQIEQARRFETPVDGATFTLRMPSEHAWRNAFEAHRDSNGRFLEAKAMRSLLDTALAGWSGVTARHFLPDAPSEAVDFSQQARGELLDCRQDIADALSIALGERRIAQRERMESARKNSSPASSGS